MQSKQTKNHFVQRVAIFLASLLLLVGMGMTALAQTSTASDDPYGLAESAGKAGFKDPQDPTTFIGVLIGNVLAFVGVVFFGLMVFGGLYWLTARGNSDRVSKAKDIIISASIGIVIVFVSYGVTQVIISQLSQSAGVTGS